MKRKSIVNSFKIGLTSIIILSLFLFLITGINAASENEAVNASANQTTSDIVKGSSNVTSTSTGNTNTNVSPGESSKCAKINSFTASSTNITSGKSVTISWDVSNATSVEIVGLEKAVEEDLPLSGSVELFPTTSTSYVIIAFNPEGNASKCISVNVDAKGDGLIESFTASSYRVNTGDKVTLNWKSSNIKRISLLGMEKEEEDVIPLSGSYDVFPVQNTSYVLQAIGNNNELISSTLTVNVNKSTGIIIESFSAEPKIITAGDTINLSWIVKNAEKVNIKGVQTNLASIGQLEVSPKVNTTYTLEAIDKNGNIKTATTTVTVNTAKKPLAKIINFTSNVTTISKGKVITLTWSTENAKNCQIVSSDGKILDNRPLNGSISVSPNTTRTYTLVATDDNGLTTKKDIIITVN